jgi:hypothetical protein
MFSSFVETGEKYKYVSVWDEPVSSSPRSKEPLKIFIDVEAKSDCHLWLFDGDQKNTRKGYEIVIGGWNNTRSEIRRGQQGTALACCLHKTSPLETRDKSKFWIAVITEDSDMSTTVVVGQGWELWKNKFLISVDKKGKFDLKSLSVSTGFGHGGKWAIYVGEEPKEKTESDETELLSISSFREKTSIKQNAVNRFVSTPIRDTLVPTGVSTAASSPILLKRPRFNFDENSEPINVTISEKESKQVGLSIDETLAKFGTVGGGGVRRLAEPQPPAKRRQ